MAFSFVRQFLQRGNTEGESIPTYAAAQRHTIEGISTWPASLSEQRFYETLFGVALPLDAQHATQTLSVPQRLVIDVARNSLDEKSARTKAVPRLPSVIPRLLRSLRDPEASAKDYVSIINKDPAMSAAVLKLANSVYFNPTTNRIQNIDTAVVKLGIEGLRAVLSAAVMQPVVQRQSDYYSGFGQKLWEHTLCCAVTCEVLGQLRGLEPYKGYLLGLTHDIGKITIFSELCRQFKLNSTPSTPPASAFIPVMQDKAASLSATIAMDWDLPKEICTALQQQVDLDVGTQVDQYGKLLFDANLYCEAYAVDKIASDDVPLAAIARTVKAPDHLLQDLGHLSLQV